MIETILSSIPLVGVVFLVIWVITGHSGFWDAIKEISSNFLLNKKNKKQFNKICREWKAPPKKNLKNQLIKILKCVQDANKNFLD